MSKEAMKLALEALEAGEYYIDDLEAIVYAADDLGTHEDRAKMQAAITVLRLEIDALNMASKTVKRDFWEGYVPEPSAGTQVSKVWWDSEKLMAKPIPFVEFYKPVQRTWVSLTDEQMLAIVHYSQLDNARAIEAKLKEMNT